MAERKVLNKYIPPDFDPSQLKRVKAKDKTGPKLQTVRLMTPFSMRCTACGEYIYKGKKFNARKEDTLEKYYSVKIYRFHIRCTRCSSAITFRTDPKHADYAAESGAQRNFEPWRTETAANGEDDDDETELDKLEREQEQGDVMEALESKTMDAKQEMEIADALDEIRTRNAMNARADPDKLLRKMEADRIAEEMEARRRTNESVYAISETDKEVARQVFAGDGGIVVRRIADDHDDDDEVIDRLARNAERGAEAATTTTTTTAMTTTTTTGVIPPISKVMPKFVPQVARKRERGSLLGVKVAPRKTKLV